MDGSQRGGGESSTMDDMKMERDDATSPLVPLDPSRLRDMAIDQHMKPHQQHFQWTGSSPQNSSPTAHRRTPLTSESPLARGNSTGTPGMDCSTPGSVHAPASQMAPGSQQMTPTHQMMHAGGGGHMTPQHMMPGASPMSSPMAQQQQPHGQGGHMGYEQQAMQVQQYPQGQQGQQGIPPASPGGQQMYHQQQQRMGMGMMPAGGGGGQAQMMQQQQPPGYGYPPGQPQGQQHPPPGVSPQQQQWQMQQQQQYQQQQQRAAMAAQQMAHQQTGMPGQMHMQPGMGMQPQQRPMPQQAMQRAGPVYPQGAGYPPGAMQPGMQGGGMPPQQAAGAPQYPQGAQARMQMAGGGGAGAVSGAPGAGGQMIQQGMARAGYPPQYPQGYAQPPGGGAGAGGYPPQYQQRQMGGMPPRGYMQPGAGGQMVTPGYPNAGVPVQQPQTPQTPQPYTPTGGRFGRPPSSSPHVDMRSPPLMSPNQQAPGAAVNSMGAMAGMQAMQRSISGGDLPLRMPPSQFFTHDPAVIGNIQPDMCLVGCVVQVCDSERFITDKNDTFSLMLAVKLLGGDIEFGLKTLQERLPHLTHVIIESSRTPHGIACIKERKRCVTLQWLADVVTRRKLEVPWKLSHLPSIYCDAFRPHTGKLVSLCGFSGEERASLKWMIEASGAKVTPYLAKHNTMLVAKADGTEKVSRAREWEIPVLNAQWVLDVYTLPREPDMASPRYHLSSPTAEIISDPGSLEQLGDAHKQIMAAWKQPVMVHSESWQRANEQKHMIQNDENVFPDHKLTAAAKEHPAPTEEQIAEEKKRRGKEKGAEKEMEQDGEKENREEQEEKEEQEQDKLVIAFSGIEEKNEEHLKAKVLYLGGEVVEEVEKCTHLVVATGKRSERLIEAIVLGKNIVSPLWVLTSYQCRQWMDTLDFFARDEEQEKMLSYNLKLSVFRARRCSVFEDVRFYLSPSVDPSVDVLTRLIELGGGTVDEKPPSAQLLARCLETDSPYIVVAAECDVRMLSYLVEANFPIYHVEVVLMSLLRQEVVVGKEQLINVAQVLGLPSRAAFRGVPPAVAAAPRMPVPPSVQAARPMPAMKREM